MSRFHKIRQGSQAGFTIVELLIATAVFSVMLLVITATLLQIGRTYYKGVTNARTQEASRTITDDVSRAIQFSSGDVVQDVSPADIGYCIGNREYSYALNRKVDGSNTNRALVASYISSAGACTVQSITPPTMTNADSVELVGDNMRLGVFTVTPSAGNPNLYQIDVQVGYGDDDLFVDTGPPGVDLPLECKSGPGSQFCAVSRLTTMAQKRL